MLKDDQRQIDDYEVRLDAADANYQALLNLQNELNLRSSPDNWIEEQVEFLVKIGTWIGQSIFGRIGHHIIDRAPVAVKVIIPPEAIGIMYLPLEIAQFDGKPFSLNDVSLVFIEKGSSDSENRPVSDTLRVLGVFSLPTDQDALSLRRERYQLMKLIEGIAQNHSVAIDLRILQYGTTRDTLRDVLAEKDGWDLIHFSGHGSRALLALEKDDGTLDPINSRDLQRLLRRTKHRLKLVTLSACLSAAATLRETRNWLGLPETKGDSEAAKADEKEVLPSVASSLVKDLDCAVLAMRYSVGDEFAIQLAQELYEGILGREQTLTSALQVAMAKVLDEGYNAGTPPLSMAIPALFGERATSLSIEAPKKDFVAPETPMEGFPNEPERFVGRMAALGMANKAMAHKSKRSGVLFYGMAGAGKSACALELAYHYCRSRRFARFVWYQAPKEGDDIVASLRDLAMAMDSQAPGLKMLTKVYGEEDFKKWLPHLTEILEKSSILVVLDNLESLLTSEGKWRDEKWGKLIWAMLANEGMSRLILTSRQKPVEIDLERLCVVAIHALPLNEALLLAREMPNLGNMLLGKSSAGLVRGRELVNRTLNLVQGHPKLIELAEKQAVDPAILSSYLDRAAESWKGNDSRLKAFFEKGESELEAEVFLKMLYDWTRATSATLPASTRTLFHLLCALEEPDRKSWIAEQIWPNLWKHLELTGQAPALGEALTDLKPLVDCQTFEEGFRYIIHPGVAEAGLTELKQGFQASVEQEMVNFWKSLLRKAKKTEMSGTGNTVVFAALSLTSYLMRLGKWNEAARCLDDVTIRDGSYNTSSAILPMLRRIAEATKGTEYGRKNAGLLAKALIGINQWPEAEAMFRSLIYECIKYGEFNSAIACANELFDILLSTGQLEEALRILDVMKSCRCKANLGSKAELFIEGKKLQVLNELGKYIEVLTAIECLRNQIEALPKRAEKGDYVEPWVVREMIFSAGLVAAMESNNHEKAIWFNNEILKSKKARGTSDLDLASTLFNFYRPLVILGQCSQAKKLLLDCKDTYERERDLKRLGRVFGALADVEDLSGQTNQAIKYIETALPYCYRGGDVRDISISHNNLAGYLYKTGSKRSLSHQLVGAIIIYQTVSAD